LVLGCGIANLTGQCSVVVRVKSLQNRHWS
jgi:hypothetical protein